MASRDAMMASFNATNLASSFSISCVILLTVAANLASSKRLNEIRHADAVKIKSHANPAVCKALVVMMLMER